MAVTSLLTKPAPSAPSLPPVTAPPIRWDQPLNTKPSAGPPSGGPPVRWDQPLTAKGSPAGPSGGGLPVRWDQPPSSMPSSNMRATPAAPAAPSIRDYMSPYTDDVLKSALSNLNDVGAQRRNALGADAFNSGAFGDARHGVEDANLTTDMAKAAGDLTANVNADAFDKAMGWENTDIDRQANIAFQNAGLQNQWFGNQLSYADALLGLDQYDRGITQQKDNVNYQDWLDSRNWDADKLGQFMNFIQGTPGQQGTSSSTPDNSWASMIGAALGGLGGNKASLFGN